jgi:hypothetical protein
VLVAEKTNNKFFVQHCQENGPEILWYYFCFCPLQKKEICLKLCIFSFPSDTEKAALNAGTGLTTVLQNVFLGSCIRNLVFCSINLLIVGFDGILFTGSPSIRDLQGYTVALTNEEAGIERAHYVGVR